MASLVMKDAIILKTRPTDTSVIYVVSCHSCGFTTTQDVDKQNDALYYVYRCRACSKWNSILIPLICKIKPLEGQCSNIW